MLEVFCQSFLPAMENNNVRSGTVSPSAMFPGFLAIITAFGFCAFVPGNDSPTWPAK
jgi:hypothetical protein